MILGLGIDTVNIKRFTKVNDTFLKKCFHPLELEEYNSLKEANIQVRLEFLASRFAVKEAYSKAVGTGFGDKVHPSEIRTCSNKLGKPFIELYGDTANSAPSKLISVSISHDDPVAVAVVIIEGEINA